jgi:hypothetical protein
MLAYWTDQDMANLMRSEVASYELSKLLPTLKKSIDRRFYSFFSKIIILCISKPLK